MADLPEFDWRRTVRSRALVLLGVMALWGVLVEARLVFLQVYQRASLQQIAERQQQRTRTVAPRRGLIVDREGLVLARSVDIDSIFADPSAIDRPDEAVARICAALGDCRTAERDRLAARLGRKKAEFAWIRRSVDPRQARRVLDLKLDGVGTMKESHRFYPNRELAAPLVGFVNIDGEGAAGIEQAYNGLVRGREGTVVLQVDAHRKAFSRIERAPTEGASLELTLDAHLQHIVERELREGVAENRAVGGTALVMDPHTGEILAMASEPGFNPNDYAAVEPERWRNRAVQDVYEPGSTFKVVTAAAGFEEDVIRPSDLFDVSGGTIRIGPRVVSDVHAYGTLTFEDVIVKSSNVGAIRAGLRIGADRLGRYVSRFGFGRRLSPDFPGESAGIVWNAANWSESTLASVSMGYEISVTPLQMAAAVSAVANGGRLLQPRVVRAVIAGGRRGQVASKELGRVVEASTAAELTSLMEAVVERGTGTTAQIPGYIVAGKTGTARKVVNGRYAASQYNASFVGFVPSRQPSLTVIVVIDTPRAGAYFGGVVAAPVFRRIAEAALLHLGVSPTLNPVPPVLAARPADAAALHLAAAPAGSAPWELAVRESDGSDGMPDLAGMSAREAVRVLAGLGVSPRLHGDGVVVAQEPPPGAPMVDGAGCRLWLGRAATRPLPGSRP